MKHSVSIDATNALGDDVDFAQFQVAVNGKTFRVLLDDLYSNKIRGVIRELASNAVDAHVTAKNADAPFDIYLPNTLYPEFRIRDYGTGLSHADMMKLYVTLFESTKDDSDDVTGAFGLGSKIPFAYTDSFQVTSFYKGERRVYAAVIEGDGMPGIYHLPDLREPTDEPNGLEVSISVRADDFDRFKSELSHLVLAFPTPPNVIAEGYAPVERIWTSADGSVYAIPRNFYGTQFAVQQGCAIYPVDSSLYYQTDLWELLNDDHKYTLVIDVPIGSVDVAPDREKLSMTDRTRSFLESALTDGVKRAQAEHIELLDQAKNRREVRKIWTGFTKYLTSKIKFSLERHSAPGENWKPSNAIELTGGGDWEPIPCRAGTKRSVDPLDAIGTGIIENSIFVVFNSKDNVIRKALRYAAFVEQQNSDTKVFRLDDPSPRALERLYTLCELRPDQIISVASLDDPGPPARKKAQKSSISGVHLHEFSYYKTRETSGDIEELPQRFYWYRLDRWSNREERRSKHYAINSAVEAKFINGGIPVLTMTAKAIERLRPPANMNLNMAIETGKQRAEEDWFIELVSKRLLAKLDKPDVWDYLGYPGLSAERRFDGQKPSQELRDRVTEEAEKVLAPLREEYPLLFLNTSEAAVWYIDARNNAKELNS